jgi:hypothetical protein
VHKVNYSDDKVKTITERLNECPFGGLENPENDRMKLRTKREKPFGCSRES